MIRFNAHNLHSLDVTQLNDALAQDHLCHGKYTKLCQEQLTTLTQTQETLLTNSCTNALELAALILDIQPGDEIIMPAFTFVSTASAFVLRGATPVFVDICPDTLNIKADLIERAITPKTKAIVPVHYAAVGCDMPWIMAIAEKHGLYVVEDAAQCIGAHQREKHLGTIGHLGTLSFHYTKNISCGSGGALLINDPALIERAQICWEKGTNRQAFLNGQVDKYTWVEAGSSFMPSEITAALLSTQLAQRADITQKRQHIWQYYQTHLAPLSSEDTFRLPIVPPDCKHNAHIFYLLLKSHAMRDAYIQHMRNHGIETPFHYVPLHQSPAGEKYGTISGSLTETESLASRLVRLPLHVNLNNTDLDAVIAATHSFLTKSKVDKSQSHQAAGAKA